MKTILYFIVAAVCLYFPAKLLLRPKKHLLSAQVIFSLATTMLSVVFVCLALYTIPALHGRFWVNLIHVMVSPLVPFFFYLFTRELTSKDGIVAKNLIALIPVVLYWGLFAIMAALMGFDGWSRFVSYYYNGIGTEPDGMGTWFYWGGKSALALAYVVVMVDGNAQLKRYHFHVENYYSSLSGLASSMNTYTSLASYISLLTSISLLLSNSTTQTGPLAFLMAVVLCVLVLFFSSYTYNLEQSAKEIAKQLAEADRSFDKKNSSVQPSLTNMQKYSMALREQLENKVYLEPDIDLVQLADRIGTNRTYLSNIIRDEYGQNFSEFINSRRISYATRMMKENEGEQYPMRYIAMKCGYSSLQTFYNNFARFTGGKTPASFLKQ